MLVGVQVPPPTRTGNYTGPGLYVDSAVLVVGDGEAELGRRRLALSAGSASSSTLGDVLERLDERLDCRLGELGGRLGAARAAFEYVGVRRCVSAIHLPTVAAASGSLSQHGSVAVELLSQLGDTPADLVTAGLLLGVRLGCIRRARRRCGRGCRARTARRSTRRGPARWSPRGRRSSWGAQCGRSNCPGGLGSGSTDARGSRRLPSGGRKCRSGSSRRARTGDLPSVCEWLLVRWRASRSWAAFELLERDEGFVGGLAGPHPVVSVVPPHPGLVAGGDVVDVEEDFVPLLTIPHLEAGVARVAQDRPDCRLAPTPVRSGAGAGCAWGLPQMGMGCRRL